MSHEYTYAEARPSRTSDTALFSLIAGLLAYVFLPFVGAVAAVVLGHMALGEIRRSGGAVGGRGLAVAGLLLGYVQILGAFLLAALVVLAAIFLAAGGADVQVDGEEVTITGPAGARIEVREPDRVKVEGPGGRVEVEGERVVVTTTGGERIEVREDGEVVKTGGRDVRRAEEALTSIREALEAFRDDTGRFPSTEEGLQALVENPGGLEEGTWRGPYLESVPADPWGREYAYAHAPEGGWVYDVHSRGPDGKKSEDDVR